MSNLHKDNSVAAEHSVELEKSPVQTMPATTTQDEAQPIQQKRDIIRVPLPEPISDLIYRFHDTAQRLRKQTIASLPSWVVNRSSNTIAMIQLAGEGMMFKANGTQFVPDEHAQTWWRYIVEPPKSILRSVFSGTGVNIKWSDLKDTTYFKQAAKSFVDLDAATALDKRGNKFLINRWQARSSFAGLTGMALSAAFTDVKDSPEDIEKRTALRHNHLMGYMAKTVGEALWFPVGSVAQLGKNIVTLGNAEPNPEVSKYKRQFTGLSLTIAGICSFLSGFRNVGTIDKAIGKDVASNLKYVPNRAHSWGGAITALAGTQLLFAIGSDQGWERFGAIQWARMIFLPKSIGNRFKNDDPKAYWYLGGQVGMQSANTASFLIGGAEKREDGSIVDHKAELKAAKDKAIQEKSLRKQAKRNDSMDKAIDVAWRDVPVISTTQSIPTPTISHASSVERAMPDRFSQTTTALNA